MRTADEHTSGHLREFIAWHQSTIKRHSAKRQCSGIQQSCESWDYQRRRSTNGFSAIRKLAAEASDNGALDAQIANGIKAIKGIRQEGTRTGNWLAKQQAQQLLNAPDISTFKGLRDRAILALLLGCGLRRAEAANLTFGHIQQRDGRWVFVDLWASGTSCDLCRCQHGLRLRLTSTRRTQELDEGEGVQAHQ